MYIFSYHILYKYINILIYTNERTNTLNKMIKQNYYTIEEWIRNHREINRVEELGVVFIIRKNRLKFIVGLVCVGVGLATFPIPFTTLPLFACGFGLIGITTADILRYKRTLTNELNYKIKRWKNGLF